MALVAGVFYGLTFVPVIVMQDNPQWFPEAPKVAIVLLAVSLVQVVPESES